MSAARWYDDPELREVWTEDEDDYLEELRQRNDALFAYIRSLPRISAAVVPCRWRADYRCPTPARCRYGYECVARPTMQGADRLQRLLDEDVARICDELQDAIVGPVIDHEALEQWYESQSDIPY
jgi:hypothetical protein